MEPTPWRAKETHGRSGTREPAESGAVPQGPKPYQVALRGYWGYAWAAVGSLVTLILLFRPWISVRGPDGSVTVNAFGRMQNTTVYLNVWSTHRPRAAQISGFWAILACAAIFITVLAVVINLRLRLEAITRLVAMSTLATAVFVLITVLHINSKSGELKGMVSRTTDLGGQIGSFMNWAFGNGKLAVPGLGQSAYTSATLTQWALLASLVSFGSALAAITQWIRSSPTSLFRLPWRVQVVAKSSDTDTDTDTADDADRPTDR